MKKQYVSVLFLSLLLLAACVPQKTDKELRQDMVDELVKNKKKISIPELTQVKSGRQQTILFGLWNQYLFPLTFRVRIYDGARELSPSEQIENGYALVWENNPRILEKNGVNLRPIIILSDPSMKGERLFRIDIEETAENSTGVYSRENFRVRWN